MDFYFFTRRRRFIFDSLFRHIIFCFPFSRFRHLLPPPFISFLPLPLFAADVFTIYAASRPLRPCHFFGFFAIIFSAAGFRRFIAEIFSLFRLYFAA